MNAMKVAIRFLHENWRCFSAAVAAARKEIERSYRGIYTLVLAVGVVTSGVKTINWGCTGRILTALPDSDNVDPLGEKATVEERKMERRVNAIMVLIPWNR